VLSISNFKNPSSPFRSSDFRPEVEIIQFHTRTLKNDSVGHNGLGMGQIPR